MAQMFFRRFVTLMPNPAPENYLTYKADFQSMFNTYCFWARRVRQPMVSRADFAKALLALPGVGFFRRDGKDEVTNLRFDYEAVMRSLQR